MVLSAYPSYQNWTKEQWAWEFLRRNPEFQRQCEAFRNFPEARFKRYRQRKTAFSYGLMKFKDYIENFDVGANPKFSSSKISFFSTGNSKGYASPLTISLRPAETLIRFNIEVMSKSNKSLGAQLKDAKKQLEKTLHSYLKKTQRTTKVTKGKAPLIECLRAYDAEIFKRTPSGKGVTYPIIADSILPQNPLPPNHVEIIKSRVARGKEYVDNLYLDIVAR